MIAPGVVGKEEKINVPQHMNHRVADISSWVAVGAMKKIVVPLH